MIEYDLAESDSDYCGIIFLRQTLIKFLYFSFFCFNERIRSSKSHN